MTRHKPAIAMGAMMGLMLPWMVHDTSGAGAFWFLAAHVAVIAIAAVTMFFFGKDYLPRWVTSHRPRLSHALPLGFGLAAGWAAICAACLVLWSV